MKLVDEFTSRNRSDLIIEVWEFLDCESIGRDEIVAIESALEERYGVSAVTSPMAIARLLADEGAELRHSEILSLFVERAEDQPYAPMFRNLLNVDSLKRAKASLAQMENLRKRFTADRDREGLRQLRALALSTKDTLKREAGTDTETAGEAAEISEWLGIWLGSPEIFSNWLELRLQSDDFRNRFADFEA